MHLYIFKHQYSTIWKIYEKKGKYMKKILLALLATSVLAMADNTTIGATMKLMEQGMEEVHKGFMYNDKDKLLSGIKTLENSNAIFTKVDVSKFIPHNNKIQVTKNINKNLSDSLSKFKKAVLNKEYTEATKLYANVVNNCIACHTIIRGW